MRTVLWGCSLAVGIGVASFTSLGAQTLTADASPQTSALKPAHHRRLQGGLDRIARQEGERAKSSSSLLRARFRHLRFSEDAQGTWIAIELVARSDSAALAARLQQLGARNIAVYERALSARVLVHRLGLLETEPSLLLARPMRATTRRGTVASQGDRSIRGPAARGLAAAGKPTGAGVIVGVMSDSFDCLGGAAADQANGEFGPVTVLRELSTCAEGQDEGRAMVQIVADVAPGSTLLFRTAFDGNADFAQGIAELVDAGADVIVDDIGYFDEPFFQDGIIAQAANAAAARGVAFFSAAGNSGRDSYESEFRGVQSTRPGESTAVFAHDFDPGRSTRLSQRVSLAAGAALSLSFQWDQSFASASPSAPGADSDLDVLLFDAAGTLVAVGGDFNIGLDAIEFLDFLNEGPRADFELRVELFSGPPPTRIKYLHIDEPPLSTQFETASGTSFGHPVAARVFGVGAAFYRDTPACGVKPPLLEEFSSAGGTRILLAADGTRLPTPQLRNKPDAVGPDGANTSFFGDDIGDQEGPSACQDADSLPNFSGTSAAAPHVAGVAALMRQTNPAATRAQIYTALRNTALDMGPPGFDFDSGSGLIRAHAAVNAILPVVKVNKTDPATLVDAD